MVSPVSTEIQWELLLVCKFNNLNFTKAWLEWVESAIMPKLSVKSVSCNSWLIKVTICHVQQEWSVPS